MSVSTAISPNLSPGASPAASRSNSLTVPTLTGELQPLAFPTLVSPFGWQLSPSHGLTRRPPVLQASQLSRLFGPLPRGAPHWAWLVCLRGRRCTLSCGFELMWEDRPNPGGGTLGEDGARSLWLALSAQRRLRGQLRAYLERPLLRPLFAFWFLPFH